MPEYFADQSDDLIEPVPFENENTEPVKTNSEDNLQALMYNSILHDMAFGGTTFNDYEGQLAQENFVSIGLREREARGFIGETGTGFERGFTGAIGSMANTLGLEGIRSWSAKRNARGENARRDDDLLSLSGFGSRLGEGLGSSVPVIAGALGGAVTGGASTAAALSFGSSFLTFYQDDVDRIYNESNGEVSYSQAVGAAIIPALIKSGIEAGIGAEAALGKAVAGKLANAGRKEVIESTGRKFMSGTFNRLSALSDNSAIKAIKKITEKRGFRLAAAVGSESMEEGLQLLTDDVTSNYLFNKNFSSLSDYMTVMADALPAGIVMGGAGHMVRKSWSKPLTDTTPADEAGMSEVIGSLPQEFTQRFIIGTQQLKEAVLPVVGGNVEEAATAVDHIARVAIGWSLRNGKNAQGVYNDPSMYLDGFKVVIASGASPEVIREFKNLSRTDSAAAYKLLEDSGVISQINAINIQNESDYFNNVSLIMQQEARHKNGGNIISEPEMERTILTQEGVAQQEALELAEMERDFTERAMQHREALDLLKIQQEALAVEKRAIPELTEEQIAELSADEQANRQTLEQVALSEEALTKIDERIASGEIAEVQERLAGVIGVTKEYNRFNEEEFQNLLNITDFSTKGVLQNLKQIAPEIQEARRQGEISMDQMKSWLEQLTGKEQKSFALSSSNEWFFEWVFATALNKDSLQEIRRVGFGDMASDTLILAMDSQRIRFDTSGGMFRFSQPLLEEAAPTDAQPELALGSVANDATEMGISEQETAALTNRAIAEQQIQLQTSKLENHEGHVNLVERNVNQTEFSFAEASKASTKKVRATRAAMGRNTGVRVGAVAHGAVERAIHAVAVEADIPTDAEIISNVLEEKIETGSRKYFQSVYSENDTDSMIDYNKYLDEVVEPALREAVKADPLFDISIDSIMDTMKRERANELFSEMEAGSTLSSQGLSDQQVLFSETVEETEAFVAERQRIIDKATGIISRRSDKRGLLKIEEDNRKLNELRGLIHQSSSTIVMDDAAQVASKEFGISKKEFTKLNKMISDSKKQNQSFESANSEKSKSVLHGAYFKGLNTAVFFETATAADILHEFVHHMSYSGLMPESHRQAVLRAYGLEGQDWTVETEEKYVKDLLGFINEGKFPDDASEAVRKSMQTMRNVLARVYQNGMKDYNLRPEVRKVFEETFFPGQEFVADVSQQIQDNINQAAASAVGVLSGEQVTEPISTAEPQTLFSEGEPEASRGPFYDQAGNAIWSRMLNTDPTEGHRDQEAGVKMLRRQLHITMNRYARGIATEAGDPIGKDKVKLNSFIDQSREYLKDNVGKSHALAKNTSEQVGDMTIDELQEAIDLLQVFPGSLKEDQRSLKKNVNNALVRLKKQVAEQSGKDRMEHLAEIASPWRAEAAAELTSRPDSIIARANNAGGMNILTKLVTTLAAKARKLNFESLNMYDISQNLDDGDRNGFFSRTLAKPLTKLNDSLLMNIKSRRKQAEDILLKRAKETGVGIPEFMDKLVTVPLSTTQKINMTLDQVVGVYIHSQGGKTDGKTIQEIIRSNDNVTDHSVRAIKDLVESTEGQELMNIVDMIRFVTDDIFKGSKQRDGLANVYGMVTGKSMGQLDWYLPMVRQDGNYGENVLGVLETIDGKITNREGKPTKEFQNAKTRTLEGDGPVDLAATRLFFRYTDAAENYIAKASTIQELSVKLKSSNVRNLMNRKYGAEVHPVLMRHLAREMSFSGRNTPLRMGEASLKWVRRQSTLAFLGGNMFTMIKQPLSLFNAMNYVNGFNATYNFVKLMGVHLANFGRQGSESFKSSEYQFMLENSPQLEFRGLDIELNELSRASRAFTQGSSGIKASGFKQTLTSGLRVKIGDQSFSDFMLNGIRAMDSVTVTAVYNTAYTQESNRLRKAGDSEALAHAGGVEYAEHVVRKTQPPTTTTERGLIQSDSEWVKAAIPFTSQFFKNYGFYVTELIAPMINNIDALVTGRKKIGEVVTARALGRTARALSASMIMPGIAAGYIARRRAPEEDEAFWDVLAYPFMGVPMVGSYMSKKIQGQDADVYGALYTQMIEAIIGTSITFARAELGAEPSDAEVKKALRDAKTGLFMVTGLPRFPIEVLDRFQRIVRESGTIDIDDLTEIMNLQAKD